MSEEDLKRRAQARIGHVLCGKYRLDAVLGIGGMAVVYAATHRNQKRVAIKLLHPELSLRSDVRARFQREGYAANSVDHPGAVAVLDDAIAEDGSAFLVMDRLEGDEVDRLAARRGGRLGPRAVLAIGEQLLAVLEAAHAKGIVHRDIKPANLFLTRDGTLKVLDFGIARVRHALWEGQSGTQTGVVSGTPAFMAPEQALGRSSDIDERSDLWAVGATMFSLLTGRQVHEGETTTAVLVRAATQPAPSLAVVLPDADPHLVALIDRALAFDKGARWPGAGALRAAVREAHLAMFGVPVSREPLEVLAGGVNELGATSLAPSAPPPALVGTQPPPPQDSRPSPRTTHAPVVARERHTAPRAARLVVGAAVLVAAGLIGAVLARRGEPTVGAPAALIRAPASNDAGATIEQPAPGASAALASDEEDDQGDEDDDAGKPSAPIVATARAAPRKPPPSSPHAPAVASVAASVAVSAPHVPPPPPPPLVCKHECVDTARACKRQCADTLRRGPERKKCVVDCVSVEKACRARAAC